MATNGNGKSNGNGNGKGRPTRYKPAFDEQARKLCLLLGATDKQLGDYFGVREQTINNWKHAHPSFLESIQNGKDNADANVAESLYHRALGYSHPDVHITNYQGEITVTDITKHYPPDTAAAFIWLKNRQRKTWRDRHEHELTGKDGEPLNVTVYLPDNKRPAND